MPIRYRFVWNEKLDRLYAINIASGALNILSGLAARLIQDISLNGNQNLSSIENRYPKFFASAIHAEWFTSNGLLCGRLIRVPESPHLKRLQIELTTKCNFNCTYCYNESGPYNKTTLSTEKIIKLITEADALGILSLDLTGGEFFLHKGWKDILKCIRDTEIPTTIHTNGYHLTHDNISYLKDHKISKVQVSMESHNPAIQSLIGRGPEKAHKRIVKNLISAKESGLKVRVSLMVHKENISTIQDSVKWFNDNLGVPVLLDRIIKNGVSGAEDLGVSEAEFWNAIAPTLTNQNDTEKACHVGKLDDETEPECGVAHSFVYITSDGYYSLCPTMTHRENLIFSGPNTSGVSLHDAWHESMLFKTYRGLNCSNLSVCPTSKKCGGGCRSNAYITTNDLRSPDTISCNTFKNPSDVYVDFLSRYKDQDFSLISSAGI